MDARGKQQQQQQQDAVDPSAGGGVMFEKLSHEDEERVLSLIDDGVKASIATMFLGREVNDGITLEQLTEIMGELQVAYDGEALAKMVPESQWEHLTLHEVNVIIGRFVDMAQRSTAEQAKQDSAVAVTAATSAVVNLDTLSYIAHMMPCSNAEEGVTYRWNRPKINVRPKTALMVSVAAMMLIVTVVLVVVVVVLNNVLVRQQVSTSHHQFADVTAAAFQQLSSTGASTVIAAALRSASDSFSAVVSGLLATYEALCYDALTGGLSRVVAAVQAELDSTLQAQLDLISFRLSMVITVFGQTGTTAGLAALLQQWDRNGDDFGPLFALATSGSSFVYRPYSITYATVDPCPDTSLAAASCLKNLSSVTPTVGTMQLCGTTYSYAAVYLPTVATSVCLFRANTDVANAVKAKLDTLVTDMNVGLSDADTTEVQAAVMLPTDTDPVLIGTRRRSPTLCVRLETCPELITGPFYTAFASSTTPGVIVNSKLQGYQAKTWMASMTWLSVVGGGRIALLYTVDREPILDLFETALGAGMLLQQRNASSDAQVILAVFDNLSNIVMLPSNQTAPTTYEAQYLTFALNNRSGSVLPQTTSPDDVIAGYTSAESTGIAVGIEFSNYGLNNATANYFVNFVNAANPDLPDGWELAVYTVTSSGALQCLTTHRKSCGSSGCGIDSAATVALATRGTDYQTGSDYKGDTVYSWYKYMPGPPQIIVLAQISKESWVDSPTSLQLIQGVIVGVVVLAVVQVLIFVLTRRIMDRIEADYTRYKHKIEEEKAQFSDLVKDVMPPYIAERIMKGTRLIAETHPQLTFFFSDIVGSTETSKTLTNKQLVRMLGYTFMLEDEVASFYGVHKIKTIGDAYFAVAGLEDSNAGVAQGHDHQVYRMVSFACVTLQLIGPAYTHFPERTECFKVSAGGTDLGPMRMVRMRMGIHTGSAVAGVVDVGRAPHFDCFGPSVNLASRMESTSTACRVQISGPTMELLTKLDTEHLFEFDAPRRTLVKGYGTMTTYLVKSTNITVPKVILDKLGIEYANSRQFFSGDAPVAPAGLAVGGGTGAPASTSGASGGAGGGGGGGGGEAPAEQAPAAAAAMPTDRTPGRERGSSQNRPSAPTGATRDREPSAPPAAKSSTSSTKPQAPRPDKEKRSRDSPAPSATAGGADLQASKSATHHAPQQQPPQPPPQMRNTGATLLPDTFPSAPGIPDFDVDVPEPPPAFDPSAFDLPPPPPPDF